MSDYCPACGNATATLSCDTCAALERARVVAVLDGWAEKRGTLTPAPRKRPKRLGGGYIVFTGKACRGFMGESRDAARAAAARAVEAGEV